MNSMKYGFSLVEMSVVLIVIALLFAAVATGVRLIEQAKLRGILTEMEEIKLAYNSFILQYSEVPGDMVHASTFFANCATGGVGNLNCNGNGDKTITYNMGGSYNGDQIGDEPSKVFRHLFLANLYDKGGTITLPNTYSASGSFVTDGYHAMSEAYEGAGYVIVGVDAGNTASSGQGAGTIYTGTASVTSSFDFLRNAIYLFRENGNGSGHLNPLQAFKLDQKIDDGSSISLSATGASSGTFRTLNDASGSNSCITDNVYSINTTSTTCIPGFVAD